MSSSRPIVTHTKTGKPVTHGSWAYNNHGCGCETCTTGHAEWKASRRAKRAAGAPKGRPGRPRRLLRSPQVEAAAETEVLK